MRHHSEVLGALLPTPQACGAVLDCAAGIGTLAMALASAGYTVEGSDLAEASIERAQREASAKGLTATFRIDDIRKLEKAPLDHYGAVLALENVLPHLGSEESMRATLQGMVARLRPGGVLAVSIRDYEKLIAEHPSVMPPTFQGQDSVRRIVHEIWDWHDERTYTFHLYITRQRDQRWEVLHFTGTYRAITTEELGHMLADAGCEDVQILSSEQSGFHQPIVYGKRKAAETVAVAEASPAISIESSATSAAETIPPAGEPAPEPIATPTEIIPPSGDAAPEFPVMPENVATPAEEPLAQPAASPADEIEVELDVDVPAAGLAMPAENIAPTATRAPEPPDNVVPFEYKEVPRAASLARPRPAAEHHPVKAEMPVIPGPALEERVLENLPATVELVLAASERASAEPAGTRDALADDEVAAQPVDITAALARLEPVLAESEEEQSPKEPALNESRPKVFIF